MGVLELTRLQPTIDHGAGWSLWSKDIIILITSDSKAGPQAWVDAYHDEHSTQSAAPLPLKSGALQGVVVLDHALNHRFESLHIVYDGINGQLPNLDLFNSAVAIASGQMGIGVSLQRMWKHGDSYRERLQTMLRGMVSQGLGHASGPHSSFIPYHVDAITLQAVGNGWQDEMAMGRCVESTFRSLNNLLEHFHQSFFFYLLMQANRFVSIGTYLPSAMLVAVNFTIMAIALWIQSGRPTKPSGGVGKTKSSEVEVVEKDGVVAVIPKEDMATVERQLFLPVVLVVAFHFLGAIPLYVFNNTRQEVSFIPRRFRLLILTSRADLGSDLTVLRLYECRPAHPSRHPDIRLHDAQLSPSHSTSMLFATPTWHVSRHTRDPQLLSCIPYRHFGRPAVFRWSTYLGGERGRTSEAQCSAEDNVQCRTTSPESACGCSGCL